MLTYITQWFDFEFVEKGKYDEKFPMAVMSQSKTPAIMINLTLK